MICDNRTIKNVKKRRFRGVSYLVNGSLVFLLESEGHFELIFTIKTNQSSKFYQGV